MTDRATIAANIEHQMSEPNKVARPEDGRPLDLGESRRMFKLGYRLEGVDDGLPPVQQYGLSEEQVISETVRLMGFHDLVYLCVELER